MKKLLFTMMLLSSAYYVSAAQTVDEAAAEAADMAKPRLILPLSSKEIQQREGMSWFTTPEEVAFLQKTITSSAEGSDLLYRNATKMQQKISGATNGQFKFGKEFTNICRMYGTLLSKTVSSHGVEGTEVAQQKVEEALNDLAKYRDHISMLHESCTKGIEKMLSNSLRKKEELEESIAKSRRRDAVEAEEQRRYEWLTMNSPMTDISYQAARNSSDWEAQSKDVHDRYLEYLEDHRARNRASAQENAR